MGYELVPYVHTFVVVFNRFFGYDLFKDKNLDEEIVKTNFEKNYISLLAGTPLFDSIILKSGATRDELAIVTKKQQKFSLIVDRGQHAFINPILQTEDANVKNKQLNSLLDMKDANLELVLFLTHALDLDLRPRQNSSLNAINQSFFFRGDWSLNIGKINAIKNLAKAIEKDSKNKTFYLTVIKNIFDKFYFVAGDWSDYTFLVQEIRPFLKNNSDLADIIFAFVDAKTKHWKSWKENDSQWTSLNNLANSSEGLLVLLHSLKKLGVEDFNLFFSHNPNLFSQAMRLYDLEVVTLLLDTMEGVLSKEEFKKQLILPDGNKDTFLISAVLNKDVGVLKTLLDKIRKFYSKEEIRQQFLSEGRVLISRAMMGNSAGGLIIFLDAMDEVLSKNELVQLLVTTGSDGRNLIMEDLRSEKAEALNVLLSFMEKLLSKEEFKKQLLWVDNEKITPIKFAINEIQKGLGFEIVLKNVEVLLKAMQKVFAAEELTKIVMEKDFYENIILTDVPSIEIFKIVMNSLNIQDKQKIFLDAIVEKNENLLMFYIGSSIRGKADLIREVLKVINDFPEGIKRSILTGTDQLNNNVLLKAVGYSDEDLLKMILNAVQGLETKDKIALFTQENFEGSNALIKAAFSAKTGENPQYLIIFLDAMKNLPIEAREKIFANGMFPDLMEFLKDAGRFDLINLIDQAIEDLNDQKQVLKNK